MPLWKFIPMAEVFVDFENTRIYNVSGKLCSDEVGYIGRDIRKLSRSIDALEFTGSIYGSWRPGIAAGNYKTIADDVDIDQNTSKLRLQVRDRVHWDGIKE